MTPSFTKSSLLAIVMFVWCAPGWTAGIEDRDLTWAGPMLGHVSDTTVTVWLRAPERTGVRGTATQAGKITAGDVHDLGDGFHIVAFTGLSPATPTDVLIRTRTRILETRTFPLTVATAPPASATGTVRLAFGSCSQDSRYPYVPVYEAMAYERPDLVVFVGDNSYFIVGDGQWATSGATGDWDSAELMQRRHLLTRTNPYIQRLLATAPCYGIWDDHDFGPNNSNRTFKNRDTALRVFKQMWANPGYGTAGTPGVFSSFRRGPVEVFLMDGRYHKYVRTEATPDVTPEEAEIWGAGQLRWLMDGLQASTAPVKLIANGTQVISKDARGEGHMQEAPAEIQKLLDFLKANRIGGIVFLTGDRHFTEVMKLDQEGGPSILEFTSSPIQQDRQVGPLPRNHGTHVWAMNGNSYGFVTVDIPAQGEGTIRFEMRDADNMVPVVNEQEMSATFPLGLTHYR